jgi:prepilin-type N-terminal cleavage/methylation domain-containing protein
MKQKHGFTLIELIVVIGVILIISVITILNYNSYTDKQRVKQAGLTLKSDLRLARTKATSGQKTTLCDSTSTLESYEVQFSKNCEEKGPCYEVKPICSHDGTSIITTDEMTRVYLPNSVTFDGVYPTIQFMTVTGVAKFLPETASTEDTIIVLSGVGGKYSVRVTASGIISDY